MSYYYQGGDVVPEDDYRGKSNAWISPSGTLIYVPECGHWDVAAMMGYKNSSAMERKGYIHISCYGFWAIPEYIPQLQLDTVIAWCDANDQEYPKQCNDRLYTNDVSGYSNPYMAYLAPSTRKAMYPLNGD